MEKSTSASRLYCWGITGNVGTSFDLAHSPAQHRRGNTDRISMPDSRIAHLHSEASQPFRLANVFWNLQARRFQQAQ
jgi:hypothetical protein